MLCLALLTFSVACKAGNSGEKEGVIDTSQTEYTAQDGQNGSEIYTPEEDVTDETYIEEIPLKQFSIFELDSLFSVICADSVEDESKAVIEICK